MRCCLCALLLLVSAVGAAWPQQIAGTVIGRLGELVSTDAGEWRFQHPAAPGGELPATDDSEWPLVRPEHSWEGASTAAWYRRLIVVPETVGGVSPAGSAVVLRCAVDDDMEVYVNGQLRGRFHWDQGNVTLTDSAQPGDKLLVAIKAINQGGPGRLLAASVVYGKFAGLRDTADECRTRLQFCQRLLEAKRIADRRAEYARTLDAAAGKLDFGAADKGDSTAFAASVAACSEALQPFAALAKEYTLYLVGHAHIDMNWLWLWPETKEVCRLTWTQALKFMEEFPDFRFSQSQPGAYLAIEQDHPELFRRIQEAVRAGQWEPVGAGWVENDMNMPSGEALARQCLLTHNYYLEKFGKTSATAWCPDTFGHAWTVPSILADAGLKYYYFCRCGKGLPTFWWEGPDGSRLMAYNFGGWYSEQMRPDRGALPLDMDGQVGVPAAMLVYGVGDHGGGPTRLDVEWAQKLQREPVFPKVEFAPTADFYNAAQQANGARLPVVRDELDSVFEGCYTTHADIKRWNREGENRNVTAEALAAIASHYGGEYPAADFTQAWRNTCFNQFHDIFDGSAIHESYDYSRGLYEQGRKIGEQSIGASLETIAAQADTRGAGQAFLLWNPVAWDRTDCVTVTLRTAERWRGAVVSDAGAKAVPAQVMASERQGDAYQTTVGFVTTLPALGYAVCHVAPAPPTALGPSHRDRQTLEALRRGLPLPLGQEGTRAAAQLQVLHEAAGGMSAWNVGPITGTETLTPVGPGAVRSGLVCTRYDLRYRYGASTMNLVATEYRTLPRMDFDLTVDWREVGNGKDGGPFLKAAFPLGIAQPRATFEIPWGAIERPLGGQEVTAQKWIDLAETKQVATAANRAPKAIDLTRFFNLDGVADLAKPTDGEFDAGARAYSAETFGAHPGQTVTVDGIPFVTPPLADGAKNAVQATGQTLEWPAERCAALAVLGASCNGRQSGMARLLYADGSEESVALELSDWCFGPGVGEVDALQCGYRLGVGGKIEPAVHIWLRRLPANPAKALRGIVLPEVPNLKLFGLAFTGRVERRDRWGVSLLNDSKYGFDVRGGTMRMSLLRASYDPDPTPDQGVHHLRYALLPHRGSWREAQTPRRAHEFNNPVIAVPVAPHAGPWPASRSFLRVAPANMILTTLKRAEDGQGYIARVYNSTGVGGRATLTCGLPVRAATACDLLEQPRAGKAASVTGSVVTLDLQGRLHGTVRFELE
jgi:alpha-mannosidase